jgi:hypothetical protein
MEQIFCVNTVHYYKNENDAIKKAQDILHHRQDANFRNQFFPYIIHYTNKGITVKLNAPWQVVKNSNLLYVYIKKIEVQ